MARNATTTRFLEELCRNERMPRPLADWVLYELQCGMGATMDRLALAAALEGCCGIPNIHRETKLDPAESALKLAAQALEALHHWWPKPLRARRLAAARAEAENGPERLLRFWCRLRSTERSIRRDEALNGRPNEDAEADHYIPQDAATAYDLATN